MNIKPLHLSFLLGSSLIIWGITPNAMAQLSDITGAIITTSDIADGIFPSPNGQRIIIAFRTPEIAAAVNQAAQLVNNQLANQSLPIVANNIPNSSISGSVQQALETVLIGSGNVQDSASQLINGLAREGSGVSRTTAQNLVSRLAGLTDGDQVSAPELQAAVEAYNQLINTSNAASLSNPSEELLAIQSVMFSLVNAALRAESL